MSADRSRRAYRLYEAALEKPASERVRYVDEVSGDDEALRSEVHSLLSGEEPLRAVTELPAEITTKERRIGTYRILSILGRGGMGDVYRALDERLERHVALKFLPVGLSLDQQRVHRFQREAKAISALNHPNIITIYEIGEAETEAGPLPFIATELIDGRTFRELITEGPLGLDTVLNIVEQVATALATAHEAGIIHRDIKPENIMVRRDGLVKVLDFGLAKLTGPRDPHAAMRERALPGRDSWTAATSDHWPGGEPGSATTPGTVLGTVSYMSPEQARGLDLDARTDIFSLGSVLYEAVTGRQPFVGATMSDRMAEILKSKPAPLHELSAGVPHWLEQIVEKALEKDRELRYQTAAELLFDLKTRRQKAPDNKGTGQRGRTVGSSPEERASRWTRISLVLPAGIVLAALLLFLLISGLPPLLERPGKIPAALTDKDTILVTEFENKTRDELFDGTLRQGLAVQLQQSPFLNLFPDARTRATLRLMNRSPDERVTRAVGSEICQRQGLKAFIAGTIAKFDRTYLLTLEAVNGRTGETIAVAQAEAEGKDRVLKALSKAATELRERLGESLASVERFDKPLEVTTSSLEALKAFSLGYREQVRGRFLETIPFYKRAVEVDPDFAYGWIGLAVQYGNTGQPALAAEAAAKAFSLRNRASEIEKLRITQYYHLYVTGELEKSLDAGRIYKEMYPRDWRAPASLAHVNFQLGQYQFAAEEARLAMRLSPDASIPYSNLGGALLRLNRFTEAKETLERALRQKLDNSYIHTYLYELAFINQDGASMDEQEAWAEGKTEEYIALEWRAAAASFGGQWRRGEQLSRRAIDRASVHAVEVAARYAADRALRAACLGQDGTARQAVTQALGLQRNRVTLPRAALALALCGETAGAEALADELAKRHPTDTLGNAVWLPLIRAALVRHNSPSTESLLAAIEASHRARRYEAAAEFWPQYLRGLIYLQLNRPAEATSEFGKILNSRGQAPLSALYPLAHLGTARALSASGHVTDSRQAFGEFFSLWKDADPDLSVLSAAKADFEKLGAR